MLSYLRKKKGSKIVKGMLIAVALTFFGGFGLIGYCNRRNTSRANEANTAAVVNGVVITRQELSEAIRRATSNKTEPMTDAEEMKLREDTLNALINQELIYQEAVRTGLQVSDEEVKQYLMQIFQKEGVFDPNIYRSYLASINSNESKFEGDIKKRLLIAKMSQAVGSGAIITDEDVHQAYIFNYQQANLQIIKIDPEKITDVPQPTQEEIAAKYKANPEGVTVPEKRKVKYACLSPSQVLKPGNVTEKEMTDFYEYAKDVKFAIQPRKVKARKIFMAAALNATEDQKSEVKERLQQVLSEIKAGTVKFEDAAKQYSEDPQTKDSGGDMGWQTIGKIGIPGDQVLRKLAVGEVSDVTHGFDGYYIFKLEEDVPGKYKPMESVKNEVIQGVIKMSGRNKVKEAAQKLADNARESKTFEEAAKMATAEVKISGLFEQKADKFENMPDSAAMIQAAFKLWDANQVSDAILIGEDACALQVTEIAEEHPATLEEAIPTLKEQILAERRKEAAKKIGDEILAAIKAGTPFEKAMAKYGNAAELIQTDFFAREKNYVPKIGHAPDLISAAFALPPHDPVAQKVFEVSGKYYLVKLFALKDADPEGFAKNQAQIKAQLLMARQGDVVDSWIESLKKKSTIVKREEPKEE